MDRKTILALVIIGIIFLTMLAQVTVVRLNIGGHTDGMRLSGDLECG